MAVYYTIVIHAAIAATIPLAKRYIPVLKIGALLLFVCTLTQVSYSIIRYRLTSS